MDPRTNFAELSDEQIGEDALNVTERVFADSVDQGHTNGKDFVATLGPVTDGVFRPWARRVIGDGEQYAANIHPDTGKLATTLDYSANSGAVVAEMEDDLPAGPRRYTGGFFHTEYVKTAERGWLSQDFAGAGSGVQGHLDQGAIGAGVLRMAALWALRMQALYGKG